MADLPETVDAILSAAKHKSTVPAQVYQRRLAETQGVAKRVLPNESKGRPTFIPRPRVQRETDPRKAAQLELCNLLMVNSTLRVGVDHLFTVASSHGDDLNAGRISSENFYDFVIGLCVTTETPYALFESKSTFYLRQRRGKEEVTTLIHLTRLGQESIQLIFDYAVPPSEAHLDLPAFYVALLELLRYIVPVSLYPAATNNYEHNQLMCTFCLETFGRAFLQRESPQHLNEFDLSPKVLKVVRSMYPVVGDMFLFCLRPRKFHGLTQLERDAEFLQIATGDSFVEYEAFSELMKEIDCRFAVISNEFVYRLFESYDVHAFADRVVVDFAGLCVILIHLSMAVYSSNAQYPTVQAKFYRFCEEFLVEKFPPQPTIVHLGEKLALTQVKPARAVLGQELWVFGNFNARETRTGSRCPLYVRFGVDGPVARGSCMAPTVGSCRVPRVARNEDSIVDIAVVDNVSTLSVTLKSTTTVIVFVSDDRLEWSKTLDVPMTFDEVLAEYTVPQELTERMRGIFTLFAPVFPRPDDGSLMLEGVALDNYLYLLGWSKICQLLPMCVIDDGDVTMMVQRHPKFFETARRHGDAPHVHLPSVTFEDFVALVFKQFVGQHGHEATHIVELITTAFKEAPSLLAERNLDMAITSSIRRRAMTRTSSMFGPGGAGMARGGSLSNLRGEIAHCANCGQDPYIKVHDNVFLELAMEATPAAKNNDDSIAMMIMKAVGKFSSNLPQDAASGAADLEEDALVKMPLDQAARMPLRMQFSYILALANKQTELAEQMRRDDETRFEKALNGVKASGKYLTSQLLTLQQCVEGIGDALFRLLSTVQETEQYCHEERKMRLSGSVVGSDTMWAMIISMFDGMKQGIRAAKDLTRPYVGGSDDRAGTMDINGALADARTFRDKIIQQATLLESKLKNKKKELLDGPGGRGVGGGAAAAAAARRHSGGNDQDAPSPGGASPLGGGAGLTSPRSSIATTPANEPTDGPISTENSTAVALELVERQLAAQREQLELSWGTRLRDLEKKKETSLKECTQLMHELLRFSQEVVEVPAPIANPCFKYLSSRGIVLQRKEPSAAGGGPGGGGGGGNGARRIDFRLHTAMTENVAVQSDEDQFPAIVDMQTELSLRGVQNAIKLGPSAVLLRKSLTCAKEALGKYMSNTALFDELSKVIRLELQNVMNPRMREMITLPVAGDMKHRDATMNTLLVSSHFAVTREEAIREIAAVAAAAAALATKASKASKKAAATAAAAAAAPGATAPLAAGKAGGGKGKPVAALAAAAAAVPTLSPTSPAPNVGSLATGFPADGAPPASMDVNSKAQFKLAVLNVQLVDDMIDALSRCKECQTNPVTFAPSISAAAAAALERKQRAAFSPADWVVPSDADLEALDMPLAWEVGVQAMPLSRNVPTQTGSAAGPNSDETGDGGDEANEGSLSVSGPRAASTLGGTVSPADGSISPQMKPSATDLASPGGASPKGPEGKKGKRGGAASPTSVAAAAATNKGGVGTSSSGGPPGTAATASSRGTPSQGAGSGGVVSPKSAVDKAALDRLQAQLAEMKNQREAQAATDAAKAKAVAEAAGKAPGPASSSPSPEATAAAAALGGLARPPVQMRLVPHPAPVSVAPAASLVPMGPPVPTIAPEPPSQQPPVTPPMEIVTAEVATEVRKVVSNAEALSIADEAATFAKTLPSMSKVNSGLGSAPCDHLAPAAHNATMPPMSNSIPASNTFSSGRRPGFFDHHGAPVSSSFESSAGIAARTSSAPAGGDLARRRYEIRRFQQYQVDQLDANGLPRPPLGGPSSTVGGDRGSSTTTTTASTTANSGVTGGSYGHPVPRASPLAHPSSGGTDMSSAEGKVRLASRFTHVTTPPNSAFPMSGTTTPMTRERLATAPLTPRTEQLLLSGDWRTVTTAESGVPSTLVDDVGNFLVQRKDGSYQHVKLGSPEHDAVASATAAAAISSPTHAQKPGVALLQQPQQQQQQQTREQQPPLQTREQPPVSPGVLEQQPTSVAGAQQQQQLQQQYFPQQRWEGASVAVSGAAWQRRGTNDTSSAATATAIAPTGLRGAPQPQATSSSESGVPHPTAVPTDPTTFATPPPVALGQTPVLLRSSSGTAGPGGVGGAPALISSPTFPPKQYAAGSFSFVKRIPPTRVAMTLAGAPGASSGNNTLGGSGSPGAGGGASTSDDADLNSLSPTLRAKFLLHTIEEMGRRVYLEPAGVQVGGAGFRVAAPSSTGPSSSTGHQLNSHEPDLRLMRGPGGARDEFNHLAGSGTEDDAAPEGGDSSSASRGLTPRDARLGRHAALATSATDQECPESPLAGGLMDGTLGSGGGTGLSLSPTGTGLTGGRPRNKPAKGKLKPSAIADPYSMLWSGGFSVQRTDEDEHEVESEFRGMADAMKAMRDRVSQLEDDKARQGDVLNAVGEELARVRQGFLARSHAPYAGGFSAAASSGSPSGEKSSVNSSSVVVGERAPADKTVQMARIVLAERDLVRRRVSHLLAIYAPGESDNFNNSGNAIGLLEITEVLEGVLRRAAQRAARRPLHDECVEFVRHQFSDEITPTFEKDQSEDPLWIVRAMCRRLGKVAGLEVGASGAATSKSSLLGSSERGVGSLVLPSAVISPDDPTYSVYGSVLEQIPHCGTYVLQRVDEFLRACAEDGVTESALAYANEVLHTTSGSSNNNATNNVAALAGATNGGARIGGAPSVLSPVQKQQPQQQAMTNVTFVEDLFPVADYVSSARQSQQRPFIPVVRDMGCQTPLRLVTVFSQEASVRSSENTSPTHGAGFSASPTLAGNQQGVASSSASGAAAAAAATGSSSILNHSLITPRFMTSAGTTTTTVIPTAATSAAGSPTHTGSTQYQQQRVQHAREAAAAASAASAAAAAQAVGARGGSPLKGGPATSTYLTDIVLPTHRADVGVQAVPFVVPKVKDLRMNDRHVGMQTENMENVGTYWSNQPLRPQLSRLFYMARTVVASSDILFNWLLTVQAAMRSHDAANLSVVAKQLESVRELSAESVGENELLHVVTCMMERALETMNHLLGRPLDPHMRSALIVDASTTTGQVSTAKAEAAEVNFLIRSLMARVDRRLANPSPEIEAHQLTLNRWRHHVVTFMLGNVDKRLYHFLSDADRATMARLVEFSSLTPAQQRKLFYLQTQALSLITFAHASDGGYVNLANAVRATPSSLPLTATSAAHVFLAKDAVLSKVLPVEFRDIAQRRKLSECNAATRMFISDVMGTTIEELAWLSSQHHPAAAQTALTQNGGAAQQQQHHLPGASASVNNFSSHSGVTAIASGVTGFVPAGDTSMTARARLEALRAQCARLRAVQPCKRDTTFATWLETLRACLCKLFGRDGRTIPSVYGDVASEPPALLRVGAVGLAKDDNNDEEEEEEGEPVVGRDRNNNNREDPHTHKQKHNADDAALVSNSDAEAAASAASRHSVVGAGRNRHQQQQQQQPAWPTHSGSLSGSASGGAAAASSPGVGGNRPKPSEDDLRLLRGRSNDNDNGNDSQSPAAKGEKGGQSATTGGTGAAAAAGLRWLPPQLHQHVAVAPAAVPTGGVASSGGGLGVVGVAAGGGSGGLPPLQRLALSPQLAGGNSGALVLPPRAPTATAMLPPTTSSSPPPSIPAFVPAHPHAHGGGGSLVPASFALVGGGGHANANAGGGGGSSAIYSAASLAHHQANSNLSSTVFSLRSMNAVKPLTAEERKELGEARALCGTAAGPPSSSGTAATWAAPTAGGGIVETVSSKAVRRWLDLELRACIAERRAASSLDSDADSIDGVLDQIVQALRRVDAGASANPGASLRSLTAAQSRLFVQYLRGHRLRGSSVLVPSLPQ